jgi:hypothetical protein
LGPFPGQDPQKPDFFKAEIFQTRGHSLPEKKFYLGQKLCVEEFSKPQNILEILKSYGPQTFGCGEFSTLNFVVCGGIFRPQILSCVEEFSDLILLFF